MSYRNDFDATLARVDALASENNKLVAENAQLRAGMTIVPPQAKRTVSRGVAAIVLATLAGAGILAAVVITDTHHVSSPAHEDKPVAVIDNASLRACARTLQLVPIDANAKATDPHGANQSISSVKRSTGCRAEINGVLESALISDEERAALARWSDAEAKLDANVAMVSEYYAHNPYDLDGYSSASQLWTEYNRALVIRNNALGQWREASR